jgi:hypothetical protein
MITPERVNLVTGSLVAGVLCAWIASAKGNRFFWPKPPTTWQRLMIAGIGVVEILSGVFWK